MSHVRSPCVLAMWISSVDNEFCLVSHLSGFGDGGEASGVNDEDAVCIDEDEDDFEPPLVRTVFTDSEEVGRFGAGELFFSSILLDLECLVWVGDLLFLEPVP